MSSSLASAAPSLRTNRRYHVGSFRQTSHSFFMSCHRTIKDLLSGDTENRFLMSGFGGSYSPNGHTFNDFLSYSMAHRPACWAYPLRAALECLVIRRFNNQTSHTGSGQLVGIAISPKHVAACSHSTAADGSTFVWFSRSGEKEYRTVTTQAELGHDLQLYRLDNPLENIQPAYLMPPAAVLDFRTACHQWVGKCHESFHTGDFCLGVWLDQTKRCTPMAMRCSGFRSPNGYSLNHYEGIDRWSKMITARPYRHRHYWSSTAAANAALLGANPLVQTDRTWYGVPITGDSGTGVVMVTPDNRAIAMMTWLNPSRGSSPVMMASEIFQQITAWGDTAYLPQLYPEVFDPSDPTAEYGDTVVDDDIRRFIEESSSGTEFIWSGYAERVGWKIPRPRLTQVGGKVLIRKGRHRFLQKRIGVMFCQPVYGAAWRQRYVVKDRPKELLEEDMTDPWAITKGESPGDPAG